MQCHIQSTHNSAFYQLLYPTRPAGGWETAVLALYSFLPPCPAEDQGAKEGLWLLQLFLPERERPPLQTASSPPPSPQTQQFSPQVCSLLCPFSLSHLRPQVTQLHCLLQHKIVKRFCVCCLPLFAKSTHLLQAEWEPEPRAGAGTVEAEVKSPFLFDPHMLPKKTVLVISGAE